MEYFEDIVVSKARRYGSYEVTREEAIAFARQFDPQPFHLSDEGTEGTPFERLALSGWHTGSIQMRLFADNVLANQASMGGLGVDELRWLHPVYPGDILTCEQTVLEKRLSRSRPAQGIVSYLTEMFNQDGTKVLRMRSAGIVGCRPAD